MASTAPFVALVAALRAHGFGAHADRLQGVLDGTWTTSSEMISALGTVVLDIRRECAPLPPAVMRLVRASLREVRGAWPGFGLLRGLLPRWFS
jgi:hypothetical protein